LKEDAPNVTYTHLKELTERLHWLRSLGNVRDFLGGVSDAKIRHFAAEAGVLDASEMRDFALLKRRTLLSAFSAADHTKPFDKREE
jgi:hypothetical protein